MIHADIYDGDDDESQLAPCLKAYRVQGCLHDEAVPIGPCSSLLNRPVSGTRSIRPLHSSENWLLSVPFAHTTIMQSRACSVLGPTVWNGLPFVLPLLLRTLSDSFYYNQLNTVTLDRAGVGRCCINP